MTWELAASGPIIALSVSAGQHVLAAGDMSARNLGLAVLGVLILLAVYLLLCLPWPYGPCLACRGHQGRNWGSNSRRHGHCRVCRGSRERLRVGSRIWLAWTSGRLPRGARRAR